MLKAPTLYRPRNYIRILTATALFDGHDVSINIIRRILQEAGVEVIHIGHNRSVQEIVKASLEEDVQGIAVSSYQGGHIEYFTYLIDYLKEREAPHIKVFGGGGGVILPDEIKTLEKHGVSRIFSPDDGANLGLEQMVATIVKAMDFALEQNAIEGLSHLSPRNPLQIARLITMAENPSKQNEQQIENLIASDTPKKVPVLGITGTGGAGKSSLTDELIQRFIRNFPDKHVAVLCCDPSKRRSGGALLGDRVRMNSISADQVFMRSLSTRQSGSELSQALPKAIRICELAGFDLIIVETAGIGQGNTLVSDLVDLPIYVMTADYGSAFQLEKIDMLDYAELIVVNKYEKRGSEDAVRDVRHQIRRSRDCMDTPLEELPVYGTTASRFNDDGVTSIYHAVLSKIGKITGVEFNPISPVADRKVSSNLNIIIPNDRIQYLTEIAKSIRMYHETTKRQAKRIRTQWHLEESIKLLKTVDCITELKNELKRVSEQIGCESKLLVDEWAKTKEKYQSDEYVYLVRNREVRATLKSKSLSRIPIPKIALPGYEDPGEIYQWLRNENLPGHFPYTAGIYPLKRAGEDPTRMFAGEGDPDRTNLRFKLLSADSTAKRLSTAFDAVTLFGRDPNETPDIYGKIGTSGVSVCTVDDMKRLYDGFNLIDPNTSVSMTINGPAPIILAMFFNVAIDQQIEVFNKVNGRNPDQKEKENIHDTTLSQVRGTVQADILKEDQGQNSCIFSIDFSLKMMGDIQEYFITKAVRNFYSVSISGYHIAEAGANPITQLALTLANGFTYVEYYLSRGMDIDAFAPNLSFFFSNGMDPEYTVLGRVARRIWAIAMKERYGGSERSRQLKYHIQTSGRSLHSRDIQFNDIRTTLQALCAIYDNCNSLHTNSYDEAITTPSDESVRRALAIQMIINKEWGPTRNENPNQGSFLVEELTQLVEEAVLLEFDRLSARGGVLGAMETGYQRGKIQEESMDYEMAKHTGEYPIIGINTFIDPTGKAITDGDITLSRSTEAEKKSQLSRLVAFQKKHQKRAPEALKKLKRVALSGDNIFGELLETVKSCSLGQITSALYEVGGQYRRNM